MSDSTQRNDAGAFRPTGALTHDAQVEPRVTQAPGTPWRRTVSGPLVELTLARVREFIREPEALFWTFLFPILISLALAIAFPTTATRAVIVGVPPGAAAEPLRRALAAVSGIEVRDVAPGAEQRALREGEVHIVVGDSVPPTYRFDPAREESRVARLVVDNALKSAAGRADPWQADEQPVSIAGSRYIDWFIPGLVGLGLMSNGMWGVGFPITQARMRNLLKRFVASPMRRRDYLLAHMLARLLGVPPEVGLPIAFGVLAFDMPINGSLAAIAIVGVIGALTFAALGLLLASRARTFEAISGLMNLAMLPMWILSGVFFSAANFPEAMQPIVQILPLTAVIDALRAVVLDGATLAGVANELAVLGIWAVASFGLALQLFRWR
jgi:ABC transporter DrrB family efflux protein